MRELMVRSVVFCSMMVIGTCVVAQQATVITGTVVTAVGEEPIPYATVVALQSGTAIMIEGATTGFDGRFELSSPTAALDLVVSFIGYRSDTCPCSLLVLTTTAGWTTWETQESCGSGCGMGHNSGSFTDDTTLAG